MPTKPMLTPQQVAAIRDWARLGTSMTAVGKKFGVTRNVVYKAVHNLHKTRGYRHEDL